MAKRVSASPPDLPGFMANGLIGSGGYADVFLYEQEMPSRQVAVKVMAENALTSGARLDLFTDEANLMARVSAHPYIVQVFQADISADGRPYLVMEYYPGQNFYDRAKREQISVPEVLRVGIQLASAVETAHQAGIYHRDIKPANVLTSEYNRPGLTDFGIASAQGPGAVADGVSIPWAPPEALGDSAPHPTADVYSLAATVYNLLAGRSPFEIPGGDNSELGLIERVEHHSVPATGRTDVTPSLERILANALSKDPAHRPSSAAEFGRQLQSVESELKLAVTALELAGGPRAVRSRVSIDDDSTRIKGVSELKAQTGDLIHQVGSSDSQAPRPPRRREGLLAEPEIADTVHRSPDPEPAQLPDQESSGRGKLYAYAGAALMTLFVLAGLASMFGGASDAEPDPALEQFEVNDGFDSPVAVTPPSVASITAVANSDGSFTFSWEAPAVGLEYLISEDDVPGIERTSDTTHTSPSDCIEVETVGDSGLISAPTRGCA